MFAFSDSALVGPPYLIALYVLAGYYVVRFLWYRLFYDLHKIPGPPMYPIVGHAHIFLQGEKPRFHPLYLEWAKQYGKVTRINILGSDVLFICDPDFIMKETQGWGGKDLPKNDQYKPFRRIVGPSGGGLFVSKHSDAKYKKVRKVVAAAFSSESLRKTFPTIADKARKMANIVNEHHKRGEAVDIQDISCNLAFDAVGKFAFDVEFHSLENGSHPLLDAMIYTSGDAMADSLNPGRYELKTLVPFLKIARDNRRMMKQLNEEHDKVADFLFSKGEPDKDDHSMGACLRRLRSLDIKLTHDELLAEFATLLGGATDTTAHQLAWTVALIASHPDVQRRLVDELQAAGLYQGGREPTYHDLSELKYLSAIVKESLRLVPVGATGSFREAESDMVVNGYRVPKGTALVTPIYSLNNAPWLWDDAMAFKPERWEKATTSTTREDSVVANRTKGASMKLWTFSYGPRDCVGQRLAVMEMQIALIVLFSRFWFELDDRMGGWKGCLDKMYNSLVVTCDGGIWVHAIPHVMLE